jgi:hypothetical protein
MENVHVVALTLRHVTVRVIFSVHHVAAGDRFARQCFRRFKVRRVFVLQAAEGSICLTICGTICTVALGARAGAVAVISPRPGVRERARVTVVERFGCRTVGSGILRVAGLKDGVWPFFVGVTRAVPTAVAVVGCLAAVWAHLAQTNQPLTTRAIRWVVRIVTTLGPDDPMASMIAHIVVLASLSFFVSILAHRVWSGLAVGVWSGRIGLTYRPSKRVRRARAATFRVGVTVIRILAGRAFL